jgi:hypothetical protein
MNYIPVTLTKLPEQITVDVNIVAIDATYPWEMRTADDSTMCVKIILRNGTELLVSESLNTVRSLIADTMSLFTILSGPK